MPIIINWIKFILKNLLKTIFLDFYLYVLVVFVHRGIPSMNIRLNSRKGIGIGVGLTLIYISIIRYFGIIWDLANLLAI